MPSKSVNAISQQRLLTSCLHVTFMCHIIHFYYSCMCYGDPRPVIFDVAAITIEGSHDR